MTGSPGNETATDIERRAAEWVARLDLSGTAEEHAALGAWLRENARHHAVYLRLSTAWERADCVRNLRPLCGKVDPDLLVWNDGVLPPPRVTRGVLVVLGVVVVVLGVLAIAAFA
ncbi:MAG: DUF4880 domain-containing protein [Gammaproteobacteria bacterium]